MLSITQCLSEKADCDLWKGCTEIVLEKCQFLLNQGEEDKLTSVMFSLMDSVDPNFTVSTSRL